MAAGLIREMSNCKVPVWQQLCVSKKRETAIGRKVRGKLGEQKND